MFPQKGRCPGGLGASCWADPEQGGQVRRREPSPGFQRSGSALQGGPLSRRRAPLPGSGLQRGSRPGRRARRLHPADRVSVHPPPLGSALIENVCFIEETPVSCAIREQASSDVKWGQEWGRAVLLSKDRGVTLNSWAGPLLGRMTSKSQVYRGTGATLHAHGRCLLCWHLPS